MLCPIRQDITIYVSLPGEDCGLGLERGALGVCPFSSLLSLLDAFFPWDEKHGKQLISHLA